MHKIANPRLIDVFGCDFSQDQVDFAIPRIKEDIPLYVDPFLFWCSNSEEYRGLHDALLSFFALVRDLVRENRITKAAELLSGCEEQHELGLGYGSATKRGSCIGPKLIASILQAHKDIPQLLQHGPRHIEEIQLVVPGVAEDRISDISGSILKQYFIQYTATRAREHGIPTRILRAGSIYDFDRQMWRPAAPTALPFNPVDGAPILFAPLDVLRHLPWINYPDYYRNAYAPYVASRDTRRQIAKAAVLEYNARNYVEVERYVAEKERTASQCKPDPLFKTLAIPTLRARFAELRGLKTGSNDGADRRYEDLVGDLLSSLLYPTLEFAENRVRTISGAHIRDLIFYNDGKNAFWKDLRERYEARQPVFELKNVKALETEHVNQLYRYLDEEFGRFGLLVTRNPASSAVQRNVVDLHSSKRVSIICIDDRDIELMLALVESGRDPNEAIKKKFLEFSRLLPK